ncbi:hypothetical protein [uncultured Dokdonia sp.]|uniref:hypothetical protein n=1 Tax=uncultured Dokdonia sp. TaxID=575653 RepID=UPI002624F2DE|nr:hypothetical protein [uncultured Dokdonia sp.]
MLKKILKIGTILNRVEQKTISGGALENRCIKRSVPCNPQRNLDDWLVNRSGEYAGCCVLPTTPDGPGPGQ